MPPQFLIDQMNESMKVAGNNQYGRQFGHPVLVKKIAEVYGKRLG